VKRPMATRLLFRSAVTARVALSAAVTLLASAPVHAQHRARLSADLADHLAAGSHTIEVIVDGAAAADRLGELRVKRAVWPLISLLQGDGRVTVRQACVRALGNIGNPSAIDALTDVIAGLVPAISIRRALHLHYWDGRDKPDKPGHDNSVRAERAAAPRTSPGSEVTGVRLICE